MTNWHYPALCGDLWQARGCGIIHVASKIEYKKNAPHFVAEVKGGSTETMEVSMLIFSTPKRIAPFGLFHNYLFSTTHNQHDRAFLMGGAL